MTVTTKLHLAQVLVDLDTKNLDRRTFTYAIPDGMETVLEIGTAVSVPFGRMKLITGYVVGFTSYIEPGIKLKEIVDILDEEPLFDLAYLEFLDWTAQYYATPLITVLSAALPSSMIQKTRREVVFDPERLSLDYSLRQTRPIQKILAFLKSRPAGKGVRVRFVASQVGLPLKLVNQGLYKLQEDGIVRVQSQSTDRMKPKMATWVSLSDAPNAETLSPRQREVWERLSTTLTETMLLSDVATLARTTPATLKKLAEQGAIQLYEAPQNRDRNALITTHIQQDFSPLVLNDEQTRATEAILKETEFQTHLLYGVTGSGKTEVYLKLTEAMLAQGKSVLILVPEISLTSHIAKRFIRRFGLEHIALWHSQLSSGEKVDAWRRIHQGDLKIVIGARSAIFTPLQDLGLVVMDEAHEGSFKQDTPAPRYHALTLAREWCRRSNAQLLLGSATPDIDTFFQAKNENRILRLAQRFGGRRMAAVDVVNMREAQGKGAPGALSAQLRDALAEKVARKEQSIILLNRRGFYTLITCNSCDETVQCPHCSVALTFHRTLNRVRCHYCGFENDRPSYCTHCASFDLSFTGLGTQRLEDEVTEALPDARILRLDSDVMQKKFAHRDVFDAFEAHEADILIGTQMVAKGLDVANVTLVGVVSADTAFSLPDYKASERGFQLLTQVAGRSGRGEKPGQVIIQTRQPWHPVIQRAQEQDYEGFYEDELTRRQEFDFPPFSQLFRFITTSPDENQAHNFMKAATLNLSEILANAGHAEEVTVLGPAPCIIGRVQGRYRFHVMLKNRGGDAIHRIVTRFYTQVHVPDPINFLLDVDAQSFL